MSEKNLYQRLSAIMKDVAYVQKEDKKVNNQYTFVSHDAVTAKIRPALVEHGVVPIVSVKSFKQDGNRTEVTLTVIFVNIDKPSEFVEIEAFGFGIDPQDKGPGKAISYAFKYAILKMFCLETGDDPEQDNIDHKPTAPKTFSGGQQADPGDGFSPIAAPDVIPFGQYRGKTYQQVLEEFGPDKMASYVTYWDNKSREDNKPITGDLLVVLNAFSKIIADLNYCRPRK
jgi:predicted RNA-binding protein